MKQDNSKKGEDTRFNRVRKHRRYSRKHILETRILFDATLGMEHHIADHASATPDASHSPHATGGQHDTTRTTSVAASQVSEFDAHQTHNQAKTINEREVKSTALDFMHDHDKALADHFAVLDASSVIGERSSFRVDIRSAHMESTENSDQILQENLERLHYPFAESRVILSTPEGTKSSNPIFTAADQASDRVYHLAGPDASSFTIDAAGDVRFKGTVDYETKDKYDITVVTDVGTKLHTAQTVDINITDLPPMISSASSADVDEGVSAGTVVYTALAADPGGGKVTYALEGTDAKSFTIDSTTGIVTINTIPDFSAQTNYGFTVKAIDASGSFSTQNVDIYVVRTFLGPDGIPITEKIVNGIIIYDPPIWIAEGTPSATVIYHGVPGPVSSNYILVGPDASSFTVDSSAGVGLLFVPNYSGQITYNITIQTWFLGTHIADEAVVVNITDVAPTITSSATANINEGVAANTPVYTVVATDQPGQAKTYALVAGGDALAFNINAATGVVTIKAIPNFETKSSYAFTVKASDPTGLFTTKAVTISVNDLAPVITSGTSGSITENAAINTTVYTAVAADPAGGTVTYSLVAGFADDFSAFNINAATGVVKINVVPNFEAKSSYNFTVKASDPSGQFTTKAVTITVNDLAPVITSGASGSITENAAANTTVYTAVAADPAGGTVTYALTGTDASAFTINSATGVVTINAVPNFETKSSYSFSVKASDPNGQFTTKAVTITVNDLPPVITSGTTGNITEGVPAGTVVYTAVAADPAGGTVAYALTGINASAFTINASTGVVTIKAIPNYETKSSYSFNVRASDPSGQFTTTAVTISVNDLPPIITSGTAGSITENAAANTTVYTAVAKDPAGGTVTYTLTGTDASAFTINASTGVVKINAIPNFEAKSSYNFNVKASDASGLFNTQAVTITVNDLPPVITSGTTGSITENAAANTTVYTAVAADPAGGTVTYALTGTDAGAFTINSATGVVKINAVPNFEAKSSYSFNVKAFDPSGQFTTKAVTINVIDLAPIITSGTTANINEGVPAGTVVYTAAAADPAGGTVTYALTGTDAGAFTINASTGVVTIKAIPNFETKSSYSFNIKASDPSGKFTTKAVTITVNDLPPVFTSSITASINEGVPVNTTVYTAVAPDPAGGTVTYSLVAGFMDDAALFNINAATGVVKINVVPNFETKSSYHFTVKAIDPSGLFNTKAVTINVTDLAPVITSGTSGSIIENAAANTTVYTAVAADPAGGTVTYSLTGTDASAFTINSATGVVKINAVPNFEAKSSYSFNVKASDPSGQFTTKAVTINVTNLAPVITSGTTGSITENAAAHTVVYTAVAADPAGGAVTYTLTGTDASAFTISPTGVVTINGVPNFETKSSYSFNVKASDPSGQFTTKAVTITVNDLPPVFTSSTTGSINEGVPANTAVYTAVAPDPAGGTVIYSLVAGVPGDDTSAFVIDPSTGVVRINTIPDFQSKSVYHFTVKASDASGQFTTQAVTINVNVNAPSHQLIVPNTSDIIFQPQGGVDALVSVDGVDYDTNKVGTFGTLFINSNTGEYRYKVNDLLTTDKLSVEESFAVTIKNPYSDEVKNVNLLFRIQTTEGSGEPIVRALIIPSEGRANGVLESSVLAALPSDVLTLTKGMTGQTVIGAIMLQPDKMRKKDRLSMAQSKNARFIASVGSLLDDYGLTK